MRFKRINQSSVWETEENLICRTCNRPVSETELLHIHGYGFFCDRNLDCFLGALQSALISDPRVKIRLITYKPPLKK